MPVFLENYNLDWVNEQEDDLLMGLLGMTIKEGTQVNGYSEYPSFYYKFGKAEIHVRTTKNDEQEKGVRLDRWDTHASGICVWDLLCTGMDITPDDGTETERVMLFRNYDVDRGSFIPIHVLNPDVLPSYLEGDRVKLQVVGLPTSIRYHENAEQFEASLPKDEDGNTWGIAEGTLFPSGLLVNHAVGNTETNSKNQITDSYIAFRGVVKDLRIGKVEMLGQELDPFIRCYIDTNLGELELDHSISQVSEDQRKNMKIGATVEGVCVISGDAAIYEHDKGIVKDFDHDLAALRFVIEKKARGEHLKKILAENAEYTSVSWKETFTGPQEIIRLLNHVQDTGSEKEFAHYAVITDKEVNELPHEIGERCLILAYDDPDKYSSIMFINVNEEGMITRIDVTNDSRYRFRIEDHKVMLSREDIPVPERCADGMRMRAKFFHMLPDETATDDLFALQNVEEFKSNTDMIIKEIKADGDVSSETLANIFGYLLVKGIETNIKELFEVGQGHYMYPISPISVEDAKNGNIQSSFPMPIQKGFQRAFKKGCQFERDFSLRFKEADVGSEAYYLELISSLTAAQSIGELYGPIFIRKIVEKEPMLIPKWIDTDNQLAAARIVEECYTTGNFEKLLSIITDDYEHHSFWVLEPMRGRETVTPYYIGKGNAIRKAGNKAKSKIVRISDKPKTVPVEKLIVDGKVVQNSRVSICADFGKACVLMEQEVDGEKIRTLAIPTVNDEGKMTQLLITEPTLYNLVPLEEA